MLRSDFLNIVDIHAALSCSLRSHQTHWGKWRFHFKGAYSLLCQTQEGWHLLLDRIIESKIFEVTVGREKKPIHVHTEAIAQQSGALNALINGHMMEAQTKSATLEDVDEETFVRFCQFAYTGDYAVPGFLTEEKSDTASDVQVASDGQARSDSNIADPVPEPAPVEEPTPVEEIALEAVVDDWGAWGKPKKPKKPSKKVRLRQSFEERAYPLPESQKRYLKECTPRVNGSPDEDYTNVFLGHARLYIFAEKWGVDSLKALTLNKLHRTLLTFNLYRGRIGDIIKLVNYAYSEDMPDHDDLRPLVTHYVACEIDTIEASELFLCLLEDGGPFVRDFWCKVRERIV